MISSLRCLAAKRKDRTIPLITGEKLRNETVLAASELKPDPEHRAQIIELIDVVEEETTDHGRDEPPERKKH